MGDFLVINDPIVLGVLLTECGAPEILRDNVVHGVCVGERKLNTRWGNRIGWFIKYVLVQRKIRRFFIKVSRKLAIVRDRCLNLRPQCLNL